MMKGFRYSFCLDIKVANPHRKLYNIIYTLRVEQIFLRNGVIRLLQK